MMRVLVPVALLGAAWSCAESSAAPASDALIATVTRGDLQITVRERGELRAARDAKVISELEGRATLIELIDEGTVVAAGDVVGKLDVSPIVEKRAQQAIAVVRAEAALEQARKQVEIADKELRAAERTAETRLEVARLRLQKFLGQDRAPSAAAAGDVAGADAGAATNRRMLNALREVLAGDDSASAGAGPALEASILRLLGSAGGLDLEMGDMAIQVLQQLDAISLTRSDLKLAERTHHFGDLLEKEGFYTEYELAQDRIDLERRRAASTVAWNNLLLLVNYSLPETLLTLRLEVENAELNVASVRAAGDARRVREDAELRSIESEYALAAEQLANWDRQIENGVLRAPGPGLVVYGRWDWDEPVFEGMEVRERQEIVILPDVTTMVADIKVPESQIGKLAVGQRAVLQMDAFPSRLFNGTVTYVASLPDPAPRSQVVKVYVATIAIDGRNEGGALRPGMSCAVTVEVGTVPDVLHVPISALERQGDEHFVWKATPAGPQAARVRLGANNLTHVEIRDGLAAGERIHLVRPPGARLPDPPAAPLADPAAAAARG